jgi:hypothetical protein
LGNYIGGGAKRGRTKRGGAKTEESIGARRGLELICQPFEFIELVKILGFPMLPRVLLKLRAT